MAKTLEDGSRAPSPSIDPFGIRPLLISAEALASWVLSDSGGLVAIAKPGWVVCHPSKHGPTSSLVGAVREHWGWETVHLISRLDRETSGLVLLARDRELASALQKAFMRGAVTKTYHALLCGHLLAATTVDRPLGEDGHSPVLTKVAAVSAGSAGAKPSRTVFVPLAWGPGHTLARIAPETGRKHQIRAHARALGRPIAADKIYGPDDRLYLRFIERGFDDRLQRFLPLPRQALHCSRLLLREDAEPLVDISAPLAADLRGLALRLLDGVDEARLTMLLGEAPTGGR